MGYIGNDTTTVNDVSIPTSWNAASYKAKVYSEGFGPHINLPVRFGIEYVYTEGLDNPW